VISFLELFENEEVHGQLVFVQFGVEDEGGRVVEPAQFDRVKSFYHRFLFGDVSAFQLQIIRF
jgi:hypothetical protein